MNSTNKQIIIRILPIVILLITIYSVIGYSSYIPLNSIFNNTTIWWGISSIMLITFLFSSIFFYDRKNQKNMIIILVYILYNFICLIRGALVAEIYWDWKLLINNAMVIMLAIATYSSTNKLLVQSVFAYYIKYVVPLFVFFVFIIRTDAYGFYLMGVSTIILFLPVLSFKKKILILIYVGVVFFSDLGARSNVIKFAIPLVLLIIYHFRKVISNKTLEILRIIIFGIPLILFLLGTTNTFNVFKIKDYLGKDISISGLDGEGNRAEESFVADTRTFLYKEVLQSAINNKYWVFGRTPARGNDSNTFGLLEFEWTGRYERASNEIGLANVFTWTGLIGVIIYSLIFMKASYMAVNKSNNIFIKMMGLYLAFRWFYSWIEDYQTFSLNYLLLIIMWGMCLSDSFRKMNEKEFTIWARGIFDSRYVKIQKTLINNSLYE